MPTATIAVEPLVCNRCQAPVTKSGLIIVSGPKPTERLCPQCFSESISVAGVHAKHEDAVATAFLCVFLGLALLGFLAWISLR